MKRIAIKDQKAAIALSSLISSEVREKALSRARRSYGSMLLLEFGCLRSIPLRRGRMSTIGEWTLVVEWSDWSISLPSSMTITEQSDEALIDRVLQQISKSKVETFAFTYRGRLHVQLADGTSLSVFGTGRPYRSLSAWVLSNERHWYLQCKGNGRFTVIPDGRVA